MKHHKEKASLNIVEFVVKYDILLYYIILVLLQIYVNKIDYPRVGITMREPMKRGGRLSSCVLLVNRIRHPKRIPTTAQWLLQGTFGIHDFKYKFV